MIFSVAMPSSSSSSSSSRSSKTCAASTSIKSKRLPLEVGNEQTAGKITVSDAPGRASRTKLASYSSIGAMWRVVGHPSAVCPKTPNASVREGEGKLVSIICSAEERGEKSTADMNYERLREVKKMFFSRSWETEKLVGSAEERGERTSATMNYERLGEMKKILFSRSWDVKNGGCGCTFGLRGVVNNEKIGNCTAKSETCDGEHGDSSGKRNLGFVRNTELEPSSLCSVDLVSSEENAVVPIAAPSGPCSAFEECQGSDDANFETLGDRHVLKDSMSVNGNNGTTVDPGIDCELFSNEPLSMQDKLSTAIEKKKHAFAGALAGTFVSICLHPVDTVKTVIQARSMSTLSNFQTFQSIVSERGLTGLYRGISSNIASSAPISAIYTYTYETIKATMIPHLPKEYQSLAHCTAGGCSSIATSFIFTPSERIKQQMQVRSYYQNCWSALIGILEKGGLSSLYAGWGAVLCRNVPHSVIKFYTYENLKNILLASSQSNANLGTTQTLLCGGISGSTAALFTTPFDVVKTRLQTQVPGSLPKYNGVFHILCHIAKHEGFRGLYRGLTPRLAVYISQGAIFFASYEFFKNVFHLDVPHRSDHKP